MKKTGAVSAAEDGQGKYADEAQRLKFPTWDHASAFSANPNCVHHDQATPLADVKVKVSPRDQDFHRSSGCSQRTGNKTGCVLSEKSRDETVMRYYWAVA